MKKTLLVLVAILLSVGTYAQTQWKVDPNHSSLNFNISHSGISFVNGKFLDYQGTMTTKDDTLNDASFNFTIQAESIDTSVENRDNHLRSADFFDVETYPTITFKSNKILATGKSDQYLLYGDLTIKDVTKPVIFDLTYGGTVTGENGVKMGLKAKTTIDRFDFNIDYDPTAAGIGKDVNIVVHLQLAKQ